MKFFLKQAGILCGILTLHLAISSFQTTEEYVFITGEWENYTEVKDKDGKTRKKDGEKIYRKLKLMFRGAGTNGGETAIANEYNMEKANGKVNITESFGFKEKKYKDPDEEEIMNYGKQTVFKKMLGGYAFSDDLKLKIVCGGVKILDQSTNKFKEYTKDDNIFKSIQKQIDGIKILKIKNESEITLEWDYNMNGTIDADETMKFKYVD